MKSIKAVIFDIGNVVLYFNNHIVSRRLSELTGLPEKRLYEYVFGLYNEMELDLGSTPAITFLESIKKEFEPMLELDQIRHIFSDIFLENLKVSNLIRQLKGKIPLLAITNTNESHFEFIGEHFPILNLLDRLIASFQLGLKKPHPGIYFESLKFTKALPQECLFIDDQEKNITPAHLLGFKTHLYRNYENLVYTLQKHEIIK